MKVSIHMIAAHTGHHYSTVMRALAASRVAVERLPGVRGPRVQLHKANKMIADHWPDVPPMSAPHVFEEVLTTAPPARREPTNSESLAMLRKS